ncbi:hypothetical protein [Bacillus wiedmannii]|uniref:Uncharacterized protein n=1 Tax=Bacillus wiedmannii TaxID=1890302 RepID=A0ABX5DPJ9_9BACI|nr:hypothetical protein [Bacillus wiedmannii]PRT38299.1 hypothetical protein C6357_21465 [Bacillus wiedmannii]
MNNNNRLWLIKTMLILIVILTFVGIDYEKILKHFSLSLLSMILIGYTISFIEAYILHFNIYQKIISSSDNKEKEGINKIFKYIGEYWSETVVIRQRESENQNRVNRHKKKSWIKQIKNITYIIFSPDYFFADVFKYKVKNKKYNEDCELKSNDLASKHSYGDKEIKCKYDKDSGKYACEEHQEKKRVKSFVIRSNWINVIFACIITVFTLLISKFFHEANLILLQSKPEILKTIIIHKDILVEYCFTFVLIKLFSRAIEVGLAFYKDVVRTKMNTKLAIGERSTNLKRGHRISLAVHSYLEFILLFSVLYYLKSNDISNILVSNTDSPFNYLDYILYSASVAAFNVSFDMQNLTTLGKLLHVLQVFLSVNLVVLSIATYLGYEDKMNKYEKEDWKKGER